MHTFMNLRNFEIYFLVFAASAIMIFNLKDFGLPALWPDETSFFITSLSMIYPPGSDLYNFAGSLGWHIGPFPIQFAPYIGALGSYISVPFQFFFGPTVTAIRLYSMTAAILLVITTYFAGRELFSKRVGIISTCLLVVFPVFIFYSRQDISYDWFVISFALMIIIFGLRFLKTLKIRYLWPALILIGIGTWEYLWFLWFVLGLVITMPIWLKSTISRIKKSEHDYLNSKNTILNNVKFSKIKLLVVSPIAFLLGLIPFITFYFVSPYWSIVSFLYRTVTGGDSAYMHTTNMNLFGNLIMRAHHFFEIFTQPNTGFTIANLNYTWNETSYVYLSLFFITIISCILYAIYKRPIDKKILGLFILIGITFISSIVTVTSFTNLQLGILLPFVFLVMGRGIEIIATRITQGRIFVKKTITPNKMIFGVLVIIALLQIPIIAEGYKIMEDAPISKYHTPYEKINQYLTENKLTPVTFDFFTLKNFLYNTDGKHVPYIIHGNWEGPDYNEDVKKNMKTAESLGVVDKKYLFVIYTFPQIEKCEDGLITNTAIRSNQCAEYYFVESTAARNNLQVQTIDFDLPDGTSYLRGLRFIEK